MTGFDSPAFLGQVPIRAGALGQEGGLPPSPPPSPPTQRVPPITIDSRPDDTRFFFPTFYPQFVYPPYGYPPSPARRRLLCRRLEEESEEEGRDVFECRQEPAPAPPPYYYPQQAFFTYPVVRHVRPFWWF